MRFWYVPRVLYGERDAHLVLNPAANGGRSGRGRARISEVLEGAGVRPVWHVTKGTWDAYEIVRGLPDRAPAVAVGVRVTDAAGASLSREFIVSVRDVAETTLWQGTSADDHWQSTSTLDDDAVLPGAGRDKIDTGGGDDVLVLIGRTAAGQFTQADLDRLVARDTQLQPHLDADHLNDRATPLLAAGARFAMGNGVDRLIVLEQGRIIERGRHDELLARNGRYAEMWRLQQSGE